MVRVGSYIAAFTVWEITARADRVVLMSARPGRIAEVLKVDLPRPRWNYDVRGTPQFTELRAHIWQRLREEKSPASGPPVD